MQITALGNKLFKSKLGRAPITRAELAKAKSMGRNANIVSTQKASALTKAKRAVKLGSPKSSAISESNSTAGRKRAKLGLKKLTAPKRAKVKVVKPLKITTKPLIKKTPKRKTARR